MNNNHLSHKKSFIKPSRWCQWNGCGLSVSESKKCAGCNCKRYHKHKPNWNYEKFVTNHNKNKQKYIKCPNYVNNNNLIQFQMQIQSINLLNIRIKNNEKKTNCNNIDVIPIKSKLTKDSKRITNWELKVKKLIKILEKCVMESFLTKSEFEYIKTSYINGKNGKIGLIIKNANLWQSNPNKFAIWLKNMRFTAIN